jgi:arsenate reductase (thioredoxin)
MTVLDFFKVGLYPYPMSKSILFLCTGNSCRSQMAEGLARKMAPDSWMVYSAGISPIEIQPDTYKVMNEIGVDISAHKSKDLHDIPMDKIDIVITLCDSAKGSCPVFPKNTKTIHWPIPDPYGACGPDDVRLIPYRNSRDEIEKKLSTFFNEIN